MIQLLQTGHLIAPLPTHPTSTASHHRACYIRDEYDNKIHAHIKAFPADSNGLANEIAGHILHHAAGIHTARRAWIIILDTTELTQLFPGIDWHGIELWPCWATEHIPGTPINTTSAWTWANQLDTWTDTPAVIAMQEWLCHIDGNTGNLISITDDEFATIDHADILGGEYWNAKTLTTNTHTRHYNKILHIVWGGTPTPAQRHAAREHAAQHPHILRDNWEKILHWWQNLLKQNDIAAAHTFLLTRAQPNWINSRI